MVALTMRAVLAALRPGDEVVIDGQRHIVELGPGGRRAVPAAARTGDLGATPDRSAKAKRPAAKSTAEGA